MQKERQFLILGQKQFTIKKCESNIRGKLERVMCGHCIKKEKHILILLLYP